MEFPFLLAQEAAPAAIPGFLGTRGSLMLDVVFLAMFLIVPLMGVSIYLVRYRRMYQLHKWLQIVMGVVLLVAVVAFEVDMRLLPDGWEGLAFRPPSPYKNEWNIVWYSLIVHLCFAVPTPVLWIYVIVQAVRQFPNPAMPSQHSAHHIFWARVSAIMMTLTAVTGWVFYYLAFVTSQ